MNIEKLQSEVDDFCSFADEYSSKMNEILSGKLTEKDIDNYLNNMDDDPTESKKKKKTNENENERLSINPQKEAKNIELNTVQKQTKNKEIEVLNESKSHKKSELNKNNTVNTKKEGIDYSKWEHFDDKESDNEEENKEPKKDNKQKKAEKKMKWKERVLNEIESHREKGNTFYKKYKFEDAINEYTIAINTAKSPDQSLVFGTSELNFMPYKSSYYALPIDFSLYNNRALCYLRLKKYKEAIDDCTEALNLQSDSEKALWRRSSAYQELKDYEMALKDLYRLKKLIENEENNKNDKNKKDSLISIKSIDERIELYEKEFKQYKKDKKILEEINDANNNPDNISLDFWINRTLKTIISLKLIKTNKNIENNINISAESKNCKMAVLTLINSFRIYPEMIDIFRATNSFQKYTNDSVLCIETFNNVVSILVEACLNSEKNLNEMSKYIHLIIAVIVNEFKKCDNLVNDKNSNTVKKIPSSLKYSHFCSFMHLLSIGFKNKLFFEKAVYNILNPSSLPHLNVFLQFYIKKSIENIKNTKEYKQDQNVDNNKDINNMKDKNIKLLKLYQNCTKYIIDWLYYILHNDNKVDGNFLLERMGIKLNLLQELYAESIYHHWVEKQVSNNGILKNKKFYNSIIIESLLEIFNYQLNQTKKLAEAKRNSIQNSKEKQNIFTYDESQYTFFLDYIKNTLFYSFNEMHCDNNKIPNYSLHYNNNTLLPCLHNYLLLITNYKKTIAINQLNEYNILEYLINDLSKSENENTHDFNLQLYDTINLILIKLYRILPNYVENQLKKNWNNKLSIFFKTLFSNIMKSSIIVNDKNKNNELDSSTNTKYTNLLYFLNNIHYIDTFLQLLFICLKKNKNEQNTTNIVNYNDIIEDWDSKYNGYNIFKFIFLNIKTLWIYNNEKDIGSNITSKIHEIKSDSEEKNIESVKEKLKLNSVQQNKESFSKVIGNTALCISECAEDVNECKKLEKYQIIDDILYFLRELSNIQAQTNLAIACSRLIKSDKIQNEFRKKGGFALLHNLGPKILGNH
ncbi:hypothetical protein PIROE2DRAFT_13076 [Piromyces sp. E2]|nr:hypothetical protein PIROE2DRAFT_13076 [Piromyces sp. E2]|eukprot:OUM61038.1 hypothetical protein PIROE2DRAFT_13076 [Piromyces sp. E2]